MDPKITRHELQTILSQLEDLLSHRKHSPFAEEVAVADLMEVITPLNNKLLDKYTKYLKRKGCAPFAQPKMTCSSVRPEKYATRFTSIIYLA